MERMRMSLVSLPIVIVTGVCLLSQAPVPQPKFEASAEDRRAIGDKTAALRSLVRELEGQRGVPQDARNDVRIFLKAGEQTGQFPEELFVAEDVPRSLKVLDQGIERAKQLKDGKTPWLEGGGRRIHGFVSDMDGSLQPYCLRVPANYDASKPARLYVWLHGRNQMNTETRFIDSEQRVTRNHSEPADEGQLQLDVYGRWNGMAYHWTGETDLFEALADVRRRYKIDPDRILLRGFSMGGCGAWHIAMHHPGKFAAAEIGAGTWPYRSQMPGFPPHQRGVLNIYENILEWSLNAFNFPLAGHGGENETGTSSIPPYAPKGAKTRGQLESSIRVREQLAKEGYPSAGDPFELKAEGMEAIFHISKGVGHSTSPEVRTKLDAFLKQYGDRGRVSPDRVRFVTWTTRYDQAHWVKVERLEKHYERAEVDAARKDGVLTVTSKNVARLMLENLNGIREVRLNGDVIPLKSASAMRFERGGKGWQPLRSGAAEKPHKEHGIQGPIDDAFMGAFLLVRPTGQAWNEAANQDALRRLSQFEALYAKHLRAKARVKTDAELTAEDFQKYNVVLFGDPGSNRWIARLAKRLPLQWSRDEIRMAGQTFTAKDHLPVLGYPGPLNPRKYVVLNTGFTFDPKEVPTEYQMPRYGDFAVLKVGGEPEIALAGLFGEDWK
jgi:pimeloyl-ACP methyl ester carboxylesterase